MLEKFRWHHGKRDAEHHEPVWSLDKCSLWVDSAKGLTVSPHSLSNKFSSKSSTMGPRKLHADLTCIWLGEAAITVSTSRLLLKNWVHTKSERKGQEESGKRFLEDHCSYARVGGARCSDSRTWNAVAFIHFLLEFSSLTCLLMITVSCSSFA